jgi:hypothetical protein
MVDMGSYLDVLWPFESMKMDVIADHHVRAVLSK